jgi:hypothetical protein
MLGGDPSLGWDCRKCIACEDQRTRNCTGGAREFVYIALRQGLWAMRFNRCPKGWLRDEAVGEQRLVEDAMRYAEHGTLPRAGAWEDQCPRFCAAVPIVANVLTQVGGPHGNS